MKQKTENSKQTAKKLPTITTIKDIFIDEITIHIAQYLPLRDLNEFSQVDSHSLKLLFNLEKNFGGNSLEENGTGQMDYDKDEVMEFERVQQLIWAPMVQYCFPKFGKNLNVKNWMHVLRRRMKHIKLHGKNFIIDTPEFAKTVEQQVYIENCEFIYKCPLQFNQLPSISNVRFCNVCNKNVYMVHDMESFEMHMIQGDCIAFTPIPPMPTSIPITSIAGGMRPPHWISTTPLTSVRASPKPTKESSRNEIKTPKSDK